MSIMPLSEFSGEKNESCDNRIMRWRERYYRQEAAISTLKSQRDELLAAAAEAVKAYDSHPSGIINPDDVLIWAQTTMTDAIGKLRVVTRAAIANAEKDKP